MPATEFGHAEQRRRDNVTIQFFGNSACSPLENGQGEQFLGSTSVTTDASGAATIPFFASTSQLVTATATDSGNNTSEFSRCVSVASPATIEATDASATGSAGIPRR